MKQNEADQIQAWAEEIRQSNRKAFDELFYFLYPQLVRIALRYTRQDAAARDIVQETFIKLWQMRRDIDSSLSLKAYMVKTVRNRSLNWLNKKSNQTISIDEHEFVFTPEEELLNHESEILAENFRKWIDELPERQNEAFELSRFEGLDHDEIAHVMEISPKTVNNHIVAALNNLRERYMNYQQSLKQD